LPWDRKSQTELATLGTSQLLKLMGFKWEELLINLGDKRNMFGAFKFFLETSKKEENRTHGFGNNREVTKSKKRHENGTPQWVNNSLQLQ
jgi:hypothetical protein